MKPRYIPKGNKGGDHRSGKASHQRKMAELAERQAVLTGKLPHMLLLEWAQSGVMEQVKTRKIGSSKKGYRFVPEKDADGNYVREVVVLDPFMRVDAAKSCANYFAAKRKEQEKPPDDRERLLDLTAERVRSKLLLALPPPIPIDG